ncbi:hypothetical protein CNECB9_4560003 [Cupriavidus necator]|uniref:Uncharacterized protein n=1 Tax=Cupriavidus necator TaxID=106590 RepID=A0A1K0ILX1_CUPNE|nr:hypothetical protein CNECB9_4560003 [Cupriavidus necator]
MRARSGGPRGRGPLTDRVAAARNKLFLSGPILVTGGVSGSPPMGANRQTIVNNLSGRECTVGHFERGAMDGGCRSCPNL